MSYLLNQTCVPCEGGVDPINKTDAESLLKANKLDWLLDDGAKQISKKWQFKNFVEALAFINKVGELAELEGHHPDIHLVNYKYVEIVLSTHAIGGLSQNDFILAAKINQLN